MAKTINFEGKLVNDPVDHELGRLPIGKLLFKMSVPMMISMFMLALYNVVDSIFVARISEAALSALSLAYPIQFFMVSINIGTNVGMTALISRSLGEKNFENANEYARHGLFLSVIYTIIFMILGFFFTESFFNAVTKDPDIRREGITYLSIITIVCAGFFLETTFEKMMQATGKSISSMITQLSGAIFNIIFDPILIFGLFGFPAMGTKGAAIATVSGQIFGLIVGIILNKYTNSDLKLKLHTFKLKLEMIKNIYIIGIPSIAMQAIGSFTILGMNSILVKYQSAVAVLGAYYKVQSFILMPIFGLTNGMVPIVSYNFGAHNKSRIMHVVKVALIAGFILIVIGGALIFTCSDIILRLFNAGENMRHIGNIAFKEISVHYPLISTNIILSSVMQATKKEVYSLIASFIRQIVFLLPSAYILSNIFGTNGLWFCYLISEFMAFLVILYLFKKTYDERIKTL